MQHEGDPKLAHTKKGGRASLSLQTDRWTDPAIAGPLACGIVSTARHQPEAWKMRVVRRHSETAMPCVTMVAL